MILYTPEALEDAAEISAWSLEQWNEHVRDRYLAGLLEACELMQRFPHFGKPTPGLPDGVLRWRYERHWLYFRVVGRDVEILRFLHEKRLPKSHLF